ncbi:MAG: glycosyltransferase [Candidatus Aenigmarchaeota archaeon]|nr:glycosyltransferase [Candidatus Aenigmarchaeota archaeon]MBU5688825.1 glycosyltransferase [Candidatus Aenigmarchaeota archaeon]
MDITLFKPLLVYINSTSFFIYNLFFFPVMFFTLYFLLVCFISIFTKYKNNYKINPKEWPFVTVQIPTYNELIALRCAKKCLQFDYPKDRYEIIIGDDSNKPEISRKIDEFASKYGIKVTRRGSNKGYKAGNLNHMLKYSKGEIIVVFDSDFIPEKDFLKRIVQPFLVDKKVGCVQAKWSFINEKQNLVTKFGSSIVMVYQRLIAPINNILQVPLLFGSGQAIRKDLIKKLGGWQEWSLTEDVEFSVRALKAGYKIVYMHDLSVKGEVPFTVRDLRKQQRKWAYGNFNAFLDHWKSIIFGKFSLPQKAMLIMTLTGYISSIFLLVFIFSGLIYFWTGEPAPFNFIKFSKETFKSIAASSGFLIAMIIVLKREKKTGMLKQIIIGAFTVGIAVTIGIASGIANAILRKRLNWYVVPKKGKVR